MRFPYRPFLSAVVAFGLIMLVRTGHASPPDTNATVTVSASAFSPDPVAPGETATSSLEALWTAPSNYTGDPSYSEPTWVWSVSGADGLTIEQENQGSSATLKAVIASPGAYTITVTAKGTWTGSDASTVTETNSTTVTVLVVGVKGLQYWQYYPTMPGDGSDIDVPATMYVPLGGWVYFTALTTPAESTFPTDNPAWSGSSGATGTGDKKTVWFNELSTTTSDYKTVTVTCGNTTVTANVIVYDFIPILTPDEDFEGRSYTRFGICETITLSHSITPSSVIESDIGSLEWQIESGGGDLTGGSGGVGNYACSDEPGEVVLRLVRSGGPCLQQDKKEAIDKDVPKLVRFVKAADSKKISQKWNRFMWFSGRYVF